MVGLNEAIPSEDVVELGPAVRLLEKYHKKVEDQIMSFTTDKEIEERQAKLEEDLKKAQEGPAEVPSDDKILAELERFAN